MAGNEAERRQDEICELNGALSVLDILLERLDLRRNEARDDCMREALDNVIELVRAYEIEYQHRITEQQAALAHKPVL